MSEIKSSTETSLTKVLSDQERQAIIMRADLRKRAQELKVNAINLSPPESTPEHKQYYQRTLSLVNKEADGQEVISKDEAAKILQEKGQPIGKRAEEMENFAPNFSAYLWSYLAKLEQASGRDFYLTIDKAKQSAQKAVHIPKLVPASLLSDAILMGIQKKSLEQMSLPSMDKIAQDIVDDEGLLKSYAFVLEENQREGFLSKIPQEQRRRVSMILDSAVSAVLHQSLVEKQTSEEEQRRQVRIRLFKELRSSLSGTEPTSKKMVKMVGNALGTLGEDARQLILELIREEADTRKIEGKGEKVDHLPRVMKIMIDNFDDWRGNDLILQTAANTRLNPHLASYLFGKLIDKDYIPKDVGEWWNERKARVKDDEQFRLEVLQKVVGDLGVIPNRQILEFIVDDSRWKEKGKVIDLAQRIEKIKSSQTEFAGIDNAPELVKVLAGDENKAMIFFLLHGGDDRYNLINTYNFDQFKEMLGLISEFKVHPEPLKMMVSALKKSGKSEQEIQSILANLQAGHFPLPDRQQAYQEISFEVSEDAGLRNANAEIGQVLGKNQLGVVLAFPVYREYLEKSGSEAAKEWILKMQGANTLAERRVIIDQIEAAYGDFRARIQKELADNWVKIGEKMVLSIGLDQVLSQEALPIRGEELLPRLDAKRIDLKRINKELLVMLKSENKAQADLGREIAKKKKVRRGLAEGLAKQTNETKKQELSRKITEIDAQLVSLEQDREAIGRLKGTDRFAHLSSEEKQAEIERLAQEIIALTEKSPSAIFTYLAMQVLGEERLRESDISLVREIESHLQGPFQMITDLHNYERNRDQRKRVRLGLQYLDKRDRLMTMVRFADSKVCCFSSNNYTMTPGHNTENKVWVASINADPLSFVISMEIPREQVLEEQGRSVKENIGFIFGSFGVNDRGEIAILYNGIYYGPGTEDSRQVKIILDGLDRIFAGIGAKTIAIASRFSGTVELPEGYSNDGVELTRLRALDDGYGDPENKIYDDLETDVDLNKPHFYSGHVWHKNF